tara:strand:+ start:384 stop:743 length:360 start_codon:yes stop_codon:yes gene_type:complete
MNNYFDKLQKIRDYFYKSDVDNKAKDFLQSSILHFAISLEVGVNTYSKNFISYEKICENIPKKIGSRSTIQSILNDAVRNNYFIKETSKIDKRIKVYFYSEQYSKMMEDWVDSNKSILI